MLTNRMLDVMLYTTIDITMNPRKTKEVKNEVNGD